LEEVIDKIISDLGEMALLEYDDGGFLEDLPLVTIFFGDPGLIPVSDFPCAYVEPILDDPEQRTTGTDRRSFTIDVSLLIDVRDHDTDEDDESFGSRALVRASYQLRKWYEKRSNLTLEGLAGVNDVSVRETRFVRAKRGTIWAKEAVTTLVIRKTSNRVLD